MIANSKNLTGAVVIVVCMWQAICPGQITASSASCEPSTLERGITNQVVLSFVATNNTSDTITDVGGDIVLSEDTHLDDSDWEIWSGTYLHDTLGPFESFGYRGPAFGGTWPLEVPFVDPGTYYIIFRVYYGGDTSYTPVEITGVPGPPEVVGLPEVVTEPATNVGLTQATLHGRIVDDGGEPCEYRFIYSELTSFVWQHTYWGGSVSSGDSFSTTVGNLNPGATYRFQAEASNSAGTDESDFREFVTGLLQASEPSPADGARHFDTWASLAWRPGYTAVSHDVYVGSSYSSVYSGTPNTSAFRGNQTTTSYVVGFLGYLYPNGLVPGRTYYWRIDEVEADGTVHKGDVWSFTVEEYVSVPILEETTLPRDRELVVPTPEDLTIGGLASHLELHFRGDPTGTADPIYIKVVDSTGAVAALVHPNPAATLIADWQVWRIPLEEIKSAGVDITKTRELRASTGQGVPSYGEGEVKTSCNVVSGALTVALYVTVRDATTAPIEGAKVTVKGKPIAGGSEHNCGNWVTNRDGECGPAGP
ncbi:MAG: fibronectin type III domain-containing protein, partial [Phycisphaerales bacterium]